ncbi:PD-(D/E)XK nuclease family protein [Lactobacillus sp. ESL0791]|uniref:PD-(D/E)XK nuclease family protein n=1 Tax=Lactobacillus sp. ESL0791 TaxID=2983234 RepID=UPI0023F7EC71|nr:PD-(D/E)XK nuclease family protein [Lactobacillus sp. ESL0791]MDF7638921.1 PD-(D/E)XK nuclease family protein [Lactobacillus sp. ESL0791]
MINILLGRQTDPLQEKILEEATKNYQQHPEQETFVIVPNHIKFTTEVRAINKLVIDSHKVTASVKNLQVLSFSRLAWYFLKDAETGLPTQLDDAAAAMLLAKIIAQKQDELLLFKTTKINSGLVKQLYSTILQVREGNLDLDEIDETNLDLETKNKVHDLRIIYDAFIANITNKFSTKNEVQLELNKLLASKTDLQNKSFFFSDFSHFTLQESLTIKLLMKRAKNVTLAFKTKLGQLDPQAQEGDYDFVIQQTISSLLRYLKGQGIAYQTASLPVSAKQDAHELLNSLWTGTISHVDELKQVQLVKADSRYAEAYFVAHTIYQQVVFQHYRYRDFLVLAPNLQEYETYLTPILRQNGIPFFNDLQQEMKYHPLVVLIENIAQLLAKPLQTQNLLAIMKTHLLIPGWYKDEAAYVHDVDELENFVLAHGINHHLWKRELTDYLDANVIRLDKMPGEIARINKLKNYFVSKISALLKQIKAETDSQKAITSFFKFLTANGITKQLDHWRHEANDQGDLQQAEQPEQVWDLLLNLLKDYLLINPDEFSAAGFFTMLVNGFKEATFSQIPSTLDAVNLSEMGMIQSDSYKQVFIIGATANNLPAVQKTPSFFSTENLQQLAGNFGEESYLEDQQQLNNLDQNYQFGISLSLAHDRVYLSYPVLNAANEQLEPSIYYEQLKNWGAPEFTQHDLPEKAQEILSFVTNPNASLGYIVYLDKATQGATKSLLKLTQEYLPAKTETVLQGQQFDNQPEDIGQELAQLLYGPNLNASVSQLETYYQNSYEYFLNYGLRLRKRFENEFDVIQAGNYFHETFDRLVKELNSKKLDLAEINQRELELLLQSAREKMKAEGQYAQLMNDPFNQYLFTCLDHTTSKVAANWHQSLKGTPLRAKYSELSFGQGERVKGLDFALPDLSGKHQVNLRGKIDRVDLAAGTENNYLAQVIDYKSSAKKFNLGLFYNGIALQMVSYLDVLVKNQQFFAGEEGMSLLGAFYQTVTQKLERINGKDLIGADLQLKNAAVDSKPRLMYTGLITNDSQLLAEAEPLLNNSGTNSKLYTGLKTKARGGFSLPRNNNFSADEMQLLLDYDEELIKEASSQILSGEIELNPYRYGKNRSALTYSDYRDVFFFDAMLKQNKYHQITNIDKPELLEKIKKRLLRKEAQDD